MKDSCENRTVLYLECSNEYTNLHMWQNCIKLNTRHTKIHELKTGKESTCHAGDLGSIPGLGRSHEEGNSYPFQCSSLENSNSPRSHKGSDTTEWLSLLQFIYEQHKFELHGSIILGVFSINTVCTTWSVVA